MVPAGDSRVLDYGPGAEIAEGDSERREGEVPHEG